jgi:hypothetical protein
MSRNGKAALERLFASKRVLLGASLVLEWLGSPGSAVSATAGRGLLWRGSRDMARRITSWPGQARFGEIRIGVVRQSRLGRAQRDEARQGSLGPFDLGTATPVISRRVRARQPRRDVARIIWVRHGKAALVWLGQAWRVDARQGETRYGSRGEASHVPAILGPSSLGGVRRLPGKAV